MNASCLGETNSKQNRQPDEARPLLLLLAVAASILYLFVRAHTPISIHAEAIHDDQHFIALGQSIANGDWLGKYDQMTLIKGPGYPLFLAANSWLGTPLSLTEALFEGLAIGVFFLVFARISRMPNLALLGYVIALWMPAPYLDRIMRDCIYPGQMLLVLSGLTASLYIEMPQKRRHLCALMTGVALGWFFLTREEGIWIIPGVAIIAVAATIRYWHEKQIKAFVLLPLIVVFGVSGLVHLAFLSINKSIYGSFVGVETNSSPFKDAVATLQSVQTGTQIAYLPVSKPTRAAIYQASPSFLKLKSYFDPPTGESPWQFGCQFYAQTCGDIAGGWFMWALRDAVNANGFYESPASAAQFYRELTRELNDACRAGKLHCKPLLFSSLPPISASQWAKLPSSLLEGLQKITLYTPSAINAPSSGSPAELMSDMEFLGRPVRTAGPSDINIYSISGWYYRAGKNDWVTGKLTSGGEIINMQIVRADSPDLISALKAPDAGHQRFSMTVSCQAPCIYSFIDAGGATAVIHLARAAGRPSNYPLNGATLNIDQISESSGPTTNADLRYRLATNMRQTMERIYGYVLPWLLPFSLIAMLATAFVGLLMRSLAATSVLAMALWALLASRLLLLALVDISSFPAMVTFYLSPAYLLACITPVLSGAALYELLKVSRQRRARMAPRPEVTHI